MNFCYECGRPTRNQEVANEEILCDKCQGEILNIPEEEKSFFIAPIILSNEAIIQRLAEYRQ